MIILKKTFNDAVSEQIRKGVDALEALKIVENSGEFNEREIQQWYDSFNKYREAK